MHTALIIGGYGFFGGRIGAALASDTRLRLLIGGRNAARANEAASAIGLAGGQGIAIDIDAPDLAGRIAALRADTVVHAAGPFQQQDYAVASTGHLAVWAGARLVRAGMLRSLAPFAGDAQAE